MRWTPQEDQTLRQMWAEEITIPEIARKMNKGQGAVKNRRKRLKLKARRTGGLTEKVRIGFDQDTMKILRTKARREGQTVVNRIRSLVMRDTREP